MRRSVVSRGKSTVSWDNFDQEDSGSSNNIASPAPPPSLPAPVPVAPKPLSQRQRAVEYLLWADRNPQGSTETNPAYQARFERHVQQKELSLAQRSIETPTTTTSTVRHISSDDARAVADTRQFNTAAFAGQKAISSEQLLALSEPSRPFSETVIQTLDSISAWFEDNGRPPHSQ